MVRVNDTLCLDFDSRDKVSQITMHLGFEQEFDDIRAIYKPEISTGSPVTDDMKINHNYGRRGVYFRDQNGLC